MPSEQRTELFVYGTLRRGEPAHALLVGAELVAAAVRTAPAFELLDLGEYPALVGGGSTAVAGEVYAVPSELLARLDEYEGCPELYVRRPLRLASGRTAEAYHLRVAPPSPRRIADGDWLRRALR